jgi:hypothetical protein
MSKKLINNWPEYKTIETDEIHSNLQVDNIMNIIAEFEFKKANLLKSQNDVAKFKSNFDTKLLIKIENMTDVEWNIYRKNK